MSVVAAEVRRAYRCGGRRGGPLPARCNRRVADLEHDGGRHELILFCERCSAEHRFALADDERPLLAALLVALARLAYHGGAMP